ncbi:MAG: hypothetical protein CVV57_08970 [Tenericutes bacterium HGW-Tenericutes-2]|jgi:hypothetical protein|nr:MAG: hypothetical protein CVV57_08970 [Tenericutes bacterium HGW-Tenericutes-2]
MKIIDYLLSGDEVTIYLTKKYLLNQESNHFDHGYIDKYLKLFDEKTNRWGNGVYGPKWISTHYTIQELKYMEISSNHPYYQRGLDTLLTYEWINKGMYSKTRHQDMCIVGMLVSFLSYGKTKNEKLFEMIDYILSHQFSDGGWNCAWDSGKNPKISSIHTTLSVLEGLSEYVKSGYTYKIEEVRGAIPKGVECLLNRDLFKNMKTGEAIHPSVIDIHYPPRWKYDILRVLEYLASIQYPYDQRMEDAIQLLIQKSKNGYMPKGSQIPGLIHFQLEKERISRFNTIRFLKIIKFYKPTLYKEWTS